jgi:hypothetical protein
MIYVLEYTDLVPVFYSEIRATPACSAVDEYDTCDVIGNLRSVWTNKPFISEIAWYCKPALKACFVICVCLLYPYQVFFCVNSMVYKTVCNSRIQLAKELQIIGIISGGGGTRLVVFTVTRQENRASK